MDYPKKLRFTSQYRNYKIFFVPPTSMLVDGQLVRKPGKVLEFKNNECICTDEEVIKIALADGYYGKDYISPEWEKMKQDEKVKAEKKINEIPEPVQTEKRRGRLAKAAA